jgi:hypothetical protein
MLFCLKKIFIQEKNVSLHCGLSINRPNTTAVR